ncbi:hypothetical protein [Neorhodopirellula lusitana]|uniref:hypothetical protein n=1 Tax=Neorhodopirellula lusitana TaxID=445327 RepID=UPI0038508121
MYKDKPRLAGRSRPASQKRIWLANLLSLGAGVSVGLAGAIASAGQPMTMPQQFRSTGGEVRSNPYAGPSANAQGNPSGTGPILQTSDLQLSELRLKSIGTAVGLVPIGGPRANTTPLEISKPSGSKIRVNPMANHTHRAFDAPVVGLVDEPVVDRSQPSPAAPPATHPDTYRGAMATSATQRTQPRIVGFAPTSPNPTDTLEFVAPQVAQTQPVVRPEAIIHALPGGLVDTVVPAIEMASPAVQIAESAPAETSMDLALAAPHVDVQPTEDAADSSDLGVTFSMTDVTMESDLDTPLAPPVLDDAASSEQQTDFALTSPATTADQTTWQASDSLAQSNESSLPDPVVLSAPSLPLLPTPSEPWVAKREIGEVVSSAKIQTRLPERPRYPQRFRPHVEVAAPPMISYQAPTRSRDSGTQVRSTPIVSASLAGFVNDKSKSQTSTGQAAGKTVAKATSPAQKLNQLVESIRRDYPTSSVSIRESKGQLVVTGSCNDREEATDIVRLVRSQFLVAVDDQLVIR